MRIRASSEWLVWNPHWRCAWRWSAMGACPEWICNTYWSIPIFDECWFSAWLGGRLPLVSDRGTLDNEPVLWRTNATFCVVRTSLLCIILRIRFQGGSYPPWSYSWERWFFCSIKRLCSLDCEPVAENPPEDTVCAAKCLMTHNLWAINWTSNWACDQGGKVLDLFSWVSIFCSLLNWDFLNWV